jgi:hypothetical protein
MNDSELLMKLNELVYGNKSSAVGSWSNILVGKECDFKVIQTIKRQGSWTKAYSYTHFCDAKDGSFSKAITTNSLLRKDEVEQLFAPFLST